MKDIVVLYHGDCSDGFGGAWAAWKKLGDKADYIGVELGAPPLAGLDDKELYMIDFAYPEKDFKDLSANNKKIIVIDHHKTNSVQATLASENLYDMTHSGSVLSWKYFHPNEPLPRLLSYVEDMDLWKFNLKNSDDIFSYIALQDREFNSWSDLALELEDENKFREFAEKGRLINIFRDKMANEIVSENATPVEFEGHKAYAVNAPHSFAGLLSKKLINKEFPMMIRWGYNSGYINVSLRSDGSVDVSEIAKKYGGGGHKTASGLRFDIGFNFPWKEVK
jgi:uncharacterized protein